MINIRRRNNKNIKIRFNKKMISKILIHLINMKNIRTNTNKSINQKIIKNWKWKNKTSIKLINQININKNFTLNNIIKITEDRKMIIKGIKSILKIRIIHNINKIHIRNKKIVINSMLKKLEKIT